MKRIAILLCDGFEEGEALFTTDVLRRAGFTAELVGVKGDTAMSSRHIKVICDRRMGEDLKDYDMIVLPGGQPGANSLRDDAAVIGLIKHFSANKKLIGAICAAPIALARADVISGRRVTCYPDKDIIDSVDAAGAVYTDCAVAADENIITAAGPACSLDFAYALTEALGKDSAQLKNGMLFGRYA